MKKSYKIIILNIEAQEGVIGENPTKKTLYIAKKETKQFRSNIGPDHLTKHLYILDLEDKIKKDDWVITTKSVTKQLCTHKIEKDDIESIKLFPYISKGKIIASTDKSLSLPTIPQSYIKYFVEEWNKGNKIKEVELEASSYNLGDIYFGSIITLLQKRKDINKWKIGLKRDETQFEADGYYGFHFKEFYLIKNNEICPIIPPKKEKIDRYNSEQYSENQGINSIEEAAKEYNNSNECVNLFPDTYTTNWGILDPIMEKMFIAGAKYQEDININLIESSQNTAIKSFELNAKLMNLVNTMYSQKEVMSLIETAFKDARNSNITVEEWFNQFKKE